MLQWSAGTVRIGQNVIPAKAGIFPYSCLLVDADMCLALLSSSEGDGNEKGIWFQQSLVEGDGEIPASGGMTP